MILTVSFVLSPGTGLSRPCRSRDHPPRALDTSVGGVTATRVRLCAAVARLATPARPSHSARHVRDDASAAPDERRIPGNNHDVLHGSRYFSQDDWTVESALNRFAKFDFSRTGFAASRSVKNQSGATACRRITGLGRARARVGGRLETAPRRSPAANPARWPDSTRCDRSRRAG
jgi:hypothetical protein